MIVQLLIHKAEVQSANAVEVPCNQLLIMVMDTGHIKCCLLHHTLTDPQLGEKERMCKALGVPSA